MSENRLSALLDSIRPEDWRTVIVLYRTAQGVIPPDILKLEIVELENDIWHANGFVLPMFRKFVFDGIPHILTQVHLAYVSQHNTFIAFEASIGGKISNAGLMVWSPFQDRLHFCGNSVDNPPITKYIDLANPVWEQQEL